MARGSKDAYTGKQKRQAEHIEAGYEERGLSEDEAERRAWATVNKTSGGGKKAGSGRKGSVTGIKKTASKTDVASKKKRASKKKVATKKKTGSKKRAVTKKKAGGKKTPTRKKKAAKTSGAKKIPVRKKSGSRKKNA